jgi:hypothetical protein
VGNVVRINLAFARSSMCLVHFSSDGQDGLSLRVVDGEGCSPLVDDTCTPVYIDMNHLVMGSIINSSTNIFVVLNSYDIRAQVWKYLGSRSNLDIAIG